MTIDLIGFYRMNEALLRFLNRVRVIPCGGCWEWDVIPKGHRYGSFYFNKRAWKAHRFSYEFLKDEIPDGLVIDHLCRNTRCVNPLHLEPVPQKENILRGNAIKATKERMAKITHCPAGHPYSKENTLMQKNRNGERTGRACRKCHAKRERERQKNT